MATSTNNLYYPKGYAVCVGINDYSKWNASGSLNLKHCISDVDYWSSECKNNRGYDEVYKFTDGNATLKNVIIAIYGISHFAIAGDVVLVHFSTHGEVSSDVNRLYLTNSGEYFTERMLRFLLKAFKPMVRVSVVTDACQSGTFLHPFESDETITPRELALVEKILTDAFPQYKTKIQNLVAAQLKLKIVANVVHFAVINDELFIPDGILTKKLRRAFKYTYWYDGEQLRDEIDSYYDEDFYDDARKFIPDIIAYAQHDKGLKTFLDSRSKAHDSMADFLKSITKSNLIFDGMHPLILASAGNFGGDTKLASDFIKVMGSWMTAKQLAWFHNPIVNYMGQPSEAFKKQYIFKKFDWDYYYEQKAKL